MTREFGDLYFPLEIPANAYRGVDQPVSVVGVANVLVVNRSMSDDLAFDITRILFEKKAELVTIHPEADHLAIELGAAWIAGCVPSGCAALLLAARRRQVDADVSLAARAL